MAVIFDIANQEQAGRFPRHGWAINSQGVKLLWFPLNHLFLQEAIRQSKGATSSNPHERTLHGVFTLALYLRELHKLLRRRVEIPIFTDSTEEITEMYEAQLLAPIFIMSAYTQVRSLVDLLIFQARFVLFDRPDQAPETFTDLKKKLSNGRQIARAKPLVDIKELENVLNAASWFDLLRAPEGGHGGIRDRLLHTNTGIMVGSSQAGDGPATFTAFMSSDLHHRELIATLKTIVGGFCELCTRIQMLVNSSHAYQRRDNVFLFGNVEDITGFWPEI